jgi:hypothetical protein
MDVARAELAEAGLSFCWRWESHQGSRREGGNLTAVKWLLPHRLRESTYRSRSLATFMHKPLLSDLVRKVEIVLPGQLFNGHLP